ncbi:MAG: NAD(P)-dependent oxidoreductase [Burkholderiaceae bacterium]
MTILITGAAGVVGTGLRREFADGARALRLFDRLDVPDLAAHEQAIRAGIGDRAALARAMQGVHAVIHLAGCTTDAPIDEQIEGNIRGAWNVFEAARDAGVERVVFGVSANTRGFFDNSEAFRLGYSPQDNAEGFAAAVLAKTPPEDAALVGTHVMGGWAANNEFVGPLERVQEW